MTTLHVTLADLCADWAAFGYSPRQAIHDLVQAHLRHGEAKGSGNRSMRRQLEIAKRTGLVRIHPKVWILPGTGYS